MRVASNSGPRPRPREEARFPAAPPAPLKPSEEAAPADSLTVTCERSQARTTQRSGPQIPDPKNPEQQ